MKKLLTGILSMALMLSFPSCNTGNNGSGTNPSSVPYEEQLIQHSIFLTEQMIGKAADDNLLQALSGDEQIASTAKPYANLKNLTPDRAIVLGFTDSSIDKMLEELANASDFSLTETSRTALRNIMLSTLAVRINGTYGALYIASLSILQQTEAFNKPADAEFTGHALVFLIYDISSNDNNWQAVSMVTFRNSQEDTILAASSFVCNDDGTLSEALYADDEDMLKNLETYLDAIGLFIPQDGIACRTYEGNQIP